MSKPVAEQWKPANIEIEQGVLGALLIYSRAYELVSGVLGPEDFFEPWHQHLFQVISDLSEAGKTTDVKTVSGFVREVDVVEGVTTRQYIARLAAEAAVPSVVGDYARTIKEMSDRRKIAQVGHDLMPREDLDAVSMAAEAIDALDEVVSHKATQGRALNMRQAVADATASIAEAYKHEGGVVGVPTTLRDLDVKTGGLSPGDLVVLAGRPGMGKSAIGLTMARRQAEKGLKILIASLEMSAEQITERMMSDVIYDMPGDRLPYFYMRNGRFAEVMFEKVTDAGRQLATLPITIDDRAGVTMMQIAARARQLKRREGLDVLVIDHLDLIRPSKRYSGNRVYELSEITSGAKALAKELSIPIIMLAQLSRQVEGRDDKRPMLSDLRSSGSIEQDADTVIFLYRASYYLANQEPKAGTPEFENWQRESEAAHNMLTAIIAKQRMGPTGNIDLFCDIGNNAVRDLEYRRQFAR